MAITEIMPRRQRRSLGCLGLGVKCLLLIMAVFVCIFIYTGTQSNNQVDKVREVGEGTLLEECRAIIYEWRLKADKLPRFEDGEGYSINREKWPPTIMKLNPLHVSVSKYDVVICMSVIPPVYIIAFADGTEQFGGEQLIDGLWRSSQGAEDARKARSSQMEEEKAKQGDEPGQAGKL